MSKIKETLKGLRWQNFVFLTVAGIINAFGITFFLSPVKLFDSGISGTSMLLAGLTPESFSLSFFLLVLNIPLFLYGLKKQGGVFTIYSIYVVGMYSLFAWLITDIFPVDVATASPMAGDDLLLCAIFGGLISGIGSGLAIRHGGAIDGVEVMAIIFAKKLNMTVGTFVMIYNVLLYIVSGFILQSWVLPLYSIITYAVALKAVDFIVEGIDHSKAVMIITGQAEGVSQELMRVFGRGTTMIAAKGGYSNTDKTMIYFVVNRFQIAKMREIVHSIDPQAYMTISEVADVFHSERSGDSTSNDNSEALKTAHIEAQNSDV